MTGGRATGYEPRLAVPLGTLELPGPWRLKRYAMTAVPGAPVDEGVLAAATARAAQDLPAAESAHGLGFLLVHRARPAYFVLLDWWQDWVDLKQRYYRAPLDGPASLGELEPAAVGCIWELEVLAHERRAWIRHVLGPDQPDAHAYLEDVSFGEHRASAQPR